MEEWRELAKTVPGTLMNVGFDIEGLLGTVTTARRKLFELVCLVYWRQIEAPFVDISDNLSTVLGGPAEDLDRVIRELARLAALHEGAGHAFLLYAERVRQGGGDDEPWQSWQLHHEDALRHAAAALRRLRAAASRARAYEDTVRSSWFIPPLSPRWAGWMMAALQLVLFARISAAMALRALRHMRKAIAREFHDTMRAVNI